MNILELFCGSRTFSKEAERQGHKTFSTDIQSLPGIDYVGDLLEIDLAIIPFKVDALWASPPCTAFSVASMGKHWGGGNRAFIPKTDTARLGLKLLRKTLEIIKEINPKYWYIENPVGVMRKVPEMRRLWRNTITYCQYGEKRMKPTDIWTNDLFWRPRPRCWNGSDCHEAAPRGSKTGTQGLKGNYERSIIPVELAEEIISSWEEGDRFEPNSNEKKNNTY